LPGFCLFSLGGIREESLALDLDLWGASSDLQSHFPHPSGSEHMDWDQLPHSWCPSRSLPFSGRAMLSLTRRTIDRPRSPGNDPTHSSASMDCYFSSGDSRRRSCSSACGNRRNLCAGLDRALKLHRLRDGFSVSNALVLKGSVF